ncbi:haloacid dehalogenase-like hydrolase [Schizosaccharomyces cryophilus OY26]|uniref:Haloacid dehalogenase-like hydrolase n=1 Tax=Schizosaccharomyces cryophilus (strain OY26 / ATCC MYA-4695 / CBS 11777 / NBRC 106824 / NRRL Y48691) TaxID=653667 RepID=S9VSK0_SCHCR|nr:haloacid dehalogenase-like hydrolase [Schizosaccharomyces cryophilus OY26]EPY50853.1 haloacid dehalogenase-like hydrolase [Schizosaccharomyces cryophilus OY26]
MSAQNRMYKACLFDMDGLLVDSETILTKTTNHLLERYGKGPLPLSIKAQMMGRPGEKAAEVVINWSKIPMTNQEFVDEQQVIRAKFWPSMTLLPGAEALLQFLNTKNIDMALATSSNTANYQMKTNHLRHAFDKFGDNVITGDDPRIPPNRGKPHPDIWLQALNLINQNRRKRNLPALSPSDCIAFEDSVPGVKSAKAAGMHVIWVPDTAILNLFRDQLKELVDDQCEFLMSLEDFQPEKFLLGA